VPAGAARDLLRSVAGRWPSYLAHVVSFATIGASWLGHNVITEYLERADAIAMFYIIPFRRWRRFPALRIPRRTGP